MVKHSVLANSDNSLELNIGPLSLSSCLGVPNIVFSFFSWLVEKLLSGFSHLQDMLFSCLWLQDCNGHQDRIN